MNRIPSFKSRFAITLIANVVRGVVTLGLGVMLARLFGATDYGRIAFLLATFMALKQLLDLGSSSAFYTLLSQQSRSGIFLLQFWFFFLGKYLLTAAVIFWVFPDSWVQSLWHGEQKSLVALAMMATAMQFDMWPNAMQMPESQRKTVKVQPIYIGALLMQVLSVAGLYWTNYLTLGNYLASVAILWFFAATLAAFLYEPERDPEKFQNTKQTLREYIEFCKPIAPFLFVGFISDFLDRWMLQEWGGSQQQGFLAISQQISGVTLIITASIIKMVWKEVAEALQRDDLESAKQIYMVTKKNMFLVGAFIACGVIPWSEEVLRLVYGNEYIPAWGVLVAMMMYSIHQSLGQFEGAFIMASGKTRIGLIFNTAMIPFGPMVSYLLLSPTHLSELLPPMGALGLALKMVLFQIFSVNVIGVLIGKVFGWRHEWVYQLQTIAVLLSFGISVKMVISVLPIAPLAALISSVVVYGIVVCIAIVLYPRIFGFGQFVFANGIKLKIKGVFNGVR
ncbi:MAG: lipopolysaccharide biosynthesis protein [Dechloromonas sp.]|nr:lipopolysaccharide biosynthesis protein [Dechloromonas sp.]